MATPWLRAARRTSSLVASNASGDRRRQDRGGQHPLGHVVDRLELRVARGDREVAHQVEVVQRLAGLRPVPAPVDLLARTAVVEVARGRGPAVADLVEDSVDVAEVGLHPRPPPRAVAEELHARSHHRPQLDRHERLDVRPVLHHPARLLLRGPLEHAGVVGTHPREQRHVVGALEHVDRVDLQHACAGEGAREGAHRGSGVARVAEPLGDEGDAAGLRLAQRGR